MNILLESKNNKTYRISSDSRQYIISEERICQKDGKKMQKGDKYYVDIAYISSLPVLFNRLVELNIRESNVSTLEELKYLYTEVYEWLKDKFKMVEE